MKFPNIASYGKIEHRVTDPINHYDEEEEPMETNRIYYLRDGDNRPVGTVCLLKANGDHARGVAWCSDSDNPCKATGRHIARGRAAKAFIKRKTTEPMNRWEVWQVSSKCDMPSLIMHKSDWNPPLTDFEKKLMGVVA